MYTCVTTYNGLSVRNHKLQNVISVSSIVVFSGFY